MVTDFGPKPDCAYANRKQVDIRGPIGPVYSGLEEARADVVGMFEFKWLVDHAANAEGQAGRVLRVVCGWDFPDSDAFGTREAHARAQIMELNYLLKGHALNFVEGCYVIDCAHVP